MSYYNWVSSAFGSSIAKKIELMKITKMVKISNKGLLTIKSAMLVIYAYF